MMLADFMAAVHLELTERQKRMIIDVVQDEVAAEREACVQSLASVANEYDHSISDDAYSAYKQALVNGIVAIRARNAKESE